MSSNTNNRSNHRTKKISTLTSEKNDNNNSKNNRNNNMRLYHHRLAAALKTVLKGPPTPRGRVTMTIKTATKTISEFVSRPMGELMIEQTRKLALHVKYT